MIKTLLVFMLCLCFQQAFARDVSFSDYTHANDVDVYFAAMANTKDKSLKNHQLMTQDISLMHSTHSMQNQSCCEMQCKRCESGCLFINVDTTFLITAPKRIFAATYLPSFPHQRVKVFFRPPIVA